ncbi:hypothetical protein [Frankia sp. AgKG'84/4]|uniref:hypothetical protein n=1 Tax=Frankia sp. AgKG'84/4 TaxID=573490 RepID=UPI00200C06BC|nr:hypothetical protein [Frankia sp. AgKG'84/4]MCL9794140.1 hypothetical protein [Frankia sp. AgKG'84/4]
MTIAYPCPRADLGCAAAFATGGDLDWHLHLTHGYRGTYRIWTSLRPPRPLGPTPPRHVPDGLVEGPGTLTIAERRAAQDGHDDPAPAPVTVADADPLTGLRPSATTGAATSHRRSRRHVRISR